MSMDAWKKANTKQILLRVTYASGIPDALEKVKAETGEDATVYIRRILQASLIRDGYMSENHEQK